MSADVHVDADRQSLIDQQSQKTSRPGTATTLADIDEPTPTATNDDEFETMSSEFKEALKREKEQLHLDLEKQMEKV